MVPPSNCTKMNMSRKPTSARENTVSIEYLERCGWSNAELIWEQIQEEAAQAWLLGDEDEASALWHGALEVADGHFASHDTRRVTSRVNASAGNQSGDGNPGAPADAVRDWAESETWVSNLKPFVRARSSMFHFRLRTKHPGAYDRTDKELYRSLFQQGLNQLRGEHDESRFRQRVARWHEQKPSGFNDYRKLLAAVLLLRCPE